jgi:hypothetical protein
MKWNHRLAIWLTDLLCPKLGRAKRRVERSQESVRTWGFDCPDFLEPDELREDDWSQWAEYISKPHVTESNRHYLETLWTKK